MSRAKKFDVLPGRMAAILLLSFLVGLASSVAFTLGWVIITGRNIWLEGMSIPFFLGFIASMILFGIFGGRWFVRGI